MSCTNEIKKSSTPSTFISWKLHLPDFGEDVLSPTFRINENWSQLAIHKFRYVWNIGEAYVIYLDNLKVGMCVSCHLVSKSGKTYEVGFALCTVESKIPSKMELSPSTIQNCKISIKEPITLLFDFRLHSDYYTDILQGNTEAERIAKSVETHVEPSVHFSCIETALEDIEKLFNNSEHSDAVVKCGDREFFVNKAILSTRSGVFAAMFRNKMTESQTGVLEIQDMDSSILEKFLRFVYSGKLSELCIDSAFHLYKTGDKYGVDSLKKVCVSYMVDHLSEDNVYETLLLADMFSDTKLLENAISFVINRNDMLKSEAWNDFADTHQALAIKVYKSFF